MRHENMQVEISIYIYLSIHLARYIDNIDVVNIDRNIGINIDVNTHTCLTHLYTYDTVIR